MSSIHFFNEDIFYSLPSPGKTRNWIKKVIHSEGYELNTLNFIFCSDKYLLSLNKQYLRHNTYTDIITFGYDEEGSSSIFGDIFISIERVLENAQKLSIPFEDELHRVIIHGVLHLLGFSDKTPSQKARMKEKEDAYLSLRG